jgi:hypothetical protein
MQVEPDRPSPVAQKPMLAMRCVDRDRHQDLVLKPWRV